MHLSPIKGGYPHKDQHDRTAPVAAGNEGIQRGTVIRANKDGEFEIAATADTFPMYLALQPYGNLEAAMAGKFSPGNGEGDPKKHPWPTNPGSWKTRDAGKYSNDTLLGGSIKPAITGIHMDDGDVWETDMFDTSESVDWDGADINAKLTVKEGLITLATGDDDTVVGFLVKKPYRRYCNDAPLVDNMITGAPRYVIQFQCGR